MKMYLIVSSDGEIDFSPVYREQEQASRKLDEMYYSLQDDLAGKYDESWIKHGVGWWFKKNDKITHTAAIKELSEGQVTYDDPKLNLLTIRQFIEWYAKAICESSNEHKTLPPYSFAIASIPSDKSDLEEINSASSGWFGLKPIEHPFEAEGTCIAVGFYGSHHFEICVFDKSKSFKTVYEVLLNRVLYIMNLYETVDENVQIITEYHPQERK